MVTGTAEHAHFTTCAAHFTIISLTYKCWPCTSLYKYSNLQFSNHEIQFKEMHIIHTVYVDQILLCF